MGIDEAGDDDGARQVDAVGGGAARGLCVAREPTATKRPLATHQAAAGAAMVWTTEALKKRALRASAVSTTGGAAYPSKIGAASIVRIAVCGARARVRHFCGELREAE